MKLMTAKEAASDLRISLSMIYRLISTGELPSYAIGGCIRVSDTDIAAYLERNRQAADFSRLAKKQHF